MLKELWCYALKNLILYKKVKKTFASKNKLFSTRKKSLVQQPYSLNNITVSSSQYVHIHRY